MRALVCRGGRNQLKAEQIVAVVPGANASERIVITLNSGLVAKPISIRSETYSEGLGWFAQSALQLSRSELTGLRNILGIPVSKACHLAMSSVESNRDDELPSDAAPRVLSFAAFKRA